MYNTVMTQTFLLALMSCLLPVYQYCQQSGNFNVWRYYVESRNCDAHIDCFFPCVMNHADKRNLRCCLQIDCKLLTLLKVMKFNVQHVSPKGSHVLAGRGVNKFLIVLTCSDLWNLQNHRSVHPSQCLARYQAIESETKHTAVRKKTLQKFSICFYLG